MLQITVSGDMTNDNVFLARSDFSHPPVNIFQIVIVVLHPFANVDFLVISLAVKTFPEAC